MTPSPHQRTLADEPWLIKFLIAQGFQKISKSSFSNGRATLRFERQQFFAIPENGSKGWHSDLSDAEPETVRQLLSNLLAVPTFQSQPQLARRAERERLLERLLENIAASIMEGPETQSGRQLRRFLWSLYNGHHVLNLWTLKSTLDSQRGRQVSEVFCGWLQGFVSEEALRKALTAAGEFQRWEAAKLADSQQTPLEEVVLKLESLLKSAPPSRPHTGLRRAHELASEALRLVSHIWGGEE